MWGEGCLTVPVARRRRGVGAENIYGEDYDSVSIALVLLVVLGLAIAQNAGARRCVREWQLSLRGRVA